MGSAYSDGGILDRVYRNTSITRSGPQDHSSITLREENTISMISGRSGCASSKECKKDAMIPIYPPYQKGGFGRHSS